VEPRITDLTISTDGKHYIRVTSWNQQSVGHYELGVSVNAAEVFRVDVTPSTAQIVPTGQVQLTGQTFDQFDVELFGREAFWSSSNDGIATVDATGLVTGQSLGTATITLESEGIQGTATIDVTNIPAAYIIITPTSGLLQVGQQVLWSAEAFDAGDNLIPGKPLTWWGSNPDVADADLGLVEAFGNGQSIIVAEADGAYGYALMTVTDPSAVPVNYWSDGAASGTIENLLGMWGAYSGAVWAVGNNGTIRFNNGGGWTGQNSGTSAALTGVWGVDDFEVWTVGSGGTILVTYDQGTTWQIEPSPTGENLLGIWGSAPNDIYAVGGSVGVAAMAHWDGANWNPVTGLPVGQALNGVYGFATDDVFAVGDNATIIRFDGTSWNTMNLPGAQSLFAVWGTSPSDVYAVGAGGTILHYDGNVGQNWVAVTPTGTTEDLLAVWGTNTDDVLAAGTNGAIVHWDGAVWSAQASGTGSTLQAIWGSPNPGVLAVGTLGTVRLGNRGATLDIAANPLILPPDGFSTSTITAQAKDATGANITSGGANVTLSSDVGTVGSVTDNTDGSYTATLTASTIVQTATITGTLNGQAVADDATVRFTSADATQSTITGAPTSIPADGASTSLITVQLVDGVGTPLTTGGDLVELFTDLGTLTAVTDVGNGTYTATLTAGTTTGFATISGTIWGQPMNNGIVTFRGTAPPDLIGSTAGGGGTNPSALYSIDRTTGAATPIGMTGFNRVGAMDLHPSTGVLYAAAQRASDATPVLIAIDQTTGVGTEIGPTGILGAISDLSFHSSGTLYGHLAIGGGHALHTFNTGTGLATLIGLTGIAGGGSGMTFNGTNSLYLASSNTLWALSTATGTGPALGTLTFSDPGCTRIKAIDLDPATGVFYAALECGATDALGILDLLGQTVTSIGDVVAELDGLVDPATSTAPSSGPASELTSQITTQATRILPDGSSTTEVGVSLYDAVGTTLDVGGDHVALSTTLGSLSALTDNGNGLYLATLTSSTTPGTATITGTVNGVAILDDATVAVSSTWQTTGSMAASRWGHTATLLDDGTVLVIGSFIAGAEIYDPATGTFGATVGTPAFTHGQSVTATKLLDGRVLIVGGNAAPTSAEIYDPGTGLFSATGSSSVDRRYHTATLLTNGKVLVAGGQDNQPQTHAVAEIYDPGTGLFTLTGSLIDDRSSPAATLLGDGRVLVVGGVQTTTPGFGICLSKGEIYDPGTGTFSAAAGDMVNARCDTHAVTLTSGEVLVIGDSQSAAELFDPTSSTFSATGSMSIGHWAGTATLLPDGRVLVAGGLEPGPVPITVAEIYNPATGSFSPTASVNTGRYDHTATLLPDGRVLVTGGYDGIVALTSAELH
jgi:hypothetical protein